MIVRRSIARNIADISDLYAAIISGVEQESEWDDTKHKDGELEKAKTERMAQHTERFVKIMVSWLVRPNVRHAADGKGTAEHPQHPGQIRQVGVYGRFTTDEG